MSTGWVAGSQAAEPDRGTGGDSERSDPVHKVLEAGWPAEALRREVRVFYYVFDVLHHEGKDLRGLPLRERRQILRGLLSFSGPLRTAHRERDGEQFWREACDKHWEGIIAKRADARYRGGRGRD